MLSGMRNRVYTFFAWVSGGIALLLGNYLLIDLLFTSIDFIFSGSFDSILQRCLEKSTTSLASIFASDVWRLDSGLKGLDLIVNWFIGLQYSVSGRWTMFALCLGIFLFLIIVGVFLDLEFIDKSSNAKTPDDISIVGLISGIVAIALISPVGWGGMIGFVEIAIEFFKSK
jgi:hypothetical protein